MGKQRDKLGDMFSAPTAQLADGQGAEAKGRNAVRALLVPPLPPVLLNPRPPPPVCNVRFDPLPPVKTSGIRVGSPAGTTRGFGESEFRDIGDMVADVLDGLQANGLEGNGAVEQQVGGRVRELCARFPIYQG